MSMRSKYLGLCHDAHQGITKCRIRAQRHFWWHGLSKEIEDYIPKLNVCIICSQVKHQPLRASVMPSRPWEASGSNLLTFECEISLIVKHVYYYSKWMEDMRT